MSITKGDNMNLYIKQHESEWYIMNNGQKAAWCTAFKTKAAATRILNKMLACIRANELWMN